MPASNQEERKAANAPPVFAPTQSAERIHVLDVLRGFALLGILFVNMAMFSDPVQLLVVPADTSLAWGDRIATWFVRFAAEGKFYTLFSLLFGLGFGIQLTRASQKGIRFGSFYTRRLLVLFGIGLIHAYLIWVGDILTLYAVVGFALLLFRNARPRVLLAWAVALVVVPMLLYAFVLGLFALGSMLPAVAEEIRQGVDQERQAYIADIRRAYDVYARGGFLEITAQRARDLKFIAWGYVSVAPSVLSMFLIGLWAARKKIFENLEANLPLFRRVLVWGLIVGVIINALIASLSERDPLNVASVATLVSVGQLLGAPVLSLFYVAALTLLHRKPGWQRRLASLARVGRMALTNYLGQSIVCTLIFYGYGLGFFGQVGKAAGLMLAIVIYAAQVWFSSWWLKYFKYGPMEWLWRSLTYLEWQPMRKPMPAATDDLERRAG